MPESARGPSSIQPILDRLIKQDDAAIGELIAMTKERLHRLARRMLSDYPIVHQFEETDDIFQNAMIRFDRALRSVQPPTETDFLKLAAVQFRRELIDMTRRYQGPNGAGAQLTVRFGYQGDEVDDSALRHPEPSDPTNQPMNNNMWTEFHEAIEKLPDQDREIVDLLWYHDLTKAEAAATLGISVREVHRRWLRARLELSNVVNKTLFYFDNHRE